MKIKNIFSLLGPGIVWAATSIGVSHIVQATRAGADYGFALLGFILLAHVIKYPFFLFGPTYSALTGKSLLHGYKTIGNWAFYLYLTLTLMTMFSVEAGVTIVTSALAYNLFGDLLTVSQWAGVILSLVTVILIIGHYKLLDLSLKWLMVVFTFLSLTALVVAISNLGLSPAHNPVTINLTNAASIAFIVALMGWMPTTIEISVWHSIWTLARFKVFGEETAKKAVIDFNIGYVTSLVLGFVFVWIGALLMFGQGTTFAASAGAFAGQLVQLYSSALGDGSWLLMALVTFLALFSTTFAVSDGFPRVWKQAYVLSDFKNPIDSTKIYALVLILLAVGSWIIISSFTKDIKALIDFVTTVSFVSAPIYAWLNYKVMMSLDKSQQPKGIFKIYTLISLLMLTTFSIYFLIWKFL